MIVSFPTYPRCPIDVERALRLARRDLRIIAAEPYADDYWGTVNGLEDAVVAMATHMAREIEHAIQLVQVDDYYHLSYYCEYTDTLLEAAREFILRHHYELRACPTQPAT